MDEMSALSGANQAYVLGVYEDYMADASSVDPSWRAFFQEPGVRQEIARLMAGEATPVAPAPAGSLEDAVAAARLVRNIRERGHLAARVNPLAEDAPGHPSLEPTTHRTTEAALAALPATIVWQEAPRGVTTALEAIEVLRRAYFGPLGYDFGHVHDFEEITWLRECVESGRFTKTPPAEERKALFHCLAEVEAFEQYIHRSFPGQKRFSVEGVDALVPMLDALVREAVTAGSTALTIGMAHRGRLSVLAHVLEKPVGAIFAEFRHDGNAHEANVTRGWTGDVKYHVGGHRTMQAEGQVSVEITLANNPSHLEFVNPVAEGMTRAAQERREAPGAPQRDPRRALAVLVHGDAAFTGEGIVAETLNLSRLAGYTTGGTVHIITNNQLGFTTEPSEDRSTLYASDLAKGFEIPVIHVNADDVEACLAAVRMAHAYRERFGRDFLIDLVGYRRYGHNEGDEPSYTQPQMSAKIASHPTVREIYGRRLVADGVITAEEAERAMAEALKGMEAADARFRDTPHGEEEVPAEGRGPDPETAVPEATLRRLNAELLARPEGFTPNAKLERLIARRGGAIDQPGGIDWAHAEALAFASLLEEGVPIRLSGQDTERGTFSQRHLVLHDIKTGEHLSVLSDLASARASFTVLNSPLSEAGAMGFEYGYSVQAKDAFVLWEAQFGDFANAAQVIIDQFVAAARAKWRETSGLTLLLPHAYEGQGPEHSSGRVERYLQLAAEENMTVANPTTAAQYFHLLRRQAHSLGEAARPLVVMTPKSLLRHPLAGASLGDLAGGSFRRVILHGAGSARRLLLMSGHVYVTIIARVGATLPEDLAIATVEELFPFPMKELQAVKEDLPRLEEVVWVQEEPKNMGPFAYVEPYLGQLFPDTGIVYAGRPPMAATAEGSPEDHAAAEELFVASAVGGAKMTVQRGARTHAR